MTKPRKAEYFITLKFGDVRTSHALKVLQDTLARLDVESVQVAPKRGFVFFHAHLDLAHAKAGKLAKTPFENVVLLNTKEHLLFELAEDSLVTINYDELIEKALAEARSLPFKEFVFVDLNEDDMTQVFNLPTHEEPSKKEIDAIMKEADSRMREPDIRKDGRPLTVQERRKLGMLSSAPAEDEEE